MPVGYVPMTAGFYVGPGDWLYYVDSAGKIKIAYSPTSKAWIYRALDTTTEAKVRAELKASGKYLGNQATAAKQAYAKIRPESATAGSTPAPSSSGSSSYTTSPVPALPPPASEPTLWEQAAPYAPYAIVGVSALLALYLVLTPPAPAARSAA